MIKIFRNFLMLSLMLASFAVFAQVAPAASTDDVLAAVLGLIGGIKGASALGISVLVVQLLMKFFSSSLSDFAGKYKLLIVTVLSLVASVLGTLYSGASIGSALVNGTVLAAVQVLVHQVYVQFIQKPAA